MNLLTRFRIGHRLALLLGSLMLLLSAIAATGAWGVETLFRSADTAMSTDNKLAHLADDARAAVLQLRRHEKDMLIQLASAERRTEHLNRWKRTAAQLKQALSEASALASTGAERQMLTEMRQQFDAYDQAMQGLARRLDANELASTQAADEALGPAKPAIRALEAASEKLSENAAARAEGIRPTLAQTRAKTLWTVVAVSLLAVLFAGVSAWLVTRSIVAPLQQAMHLAERVSTGDLSAELTSTGKDETADLLGSLGRMNRQLSVLVTELRETSEQIATGSSQIAVGNADLSQRTEEQASHLEQTSSSMTQLESTVTSTADNARAASELAQQAAGAATDGGDSVAEVARKMDEIRGRAARIAEIIGVIDGIAFQTNILALNAAVEAARAGEHGRGFAVVASEVRTLAQRSSTAARDIKLLITQSSESVDSGAAMVERACTSMDHIVGSVHKLRDLIGEISQACSDQRNGVSQVNTAVATIDQMTQQNAALVEQSAAAADSLRQQAARMAELAGRFTLRRSPAG